MPRASIISNVASRLHVAQGGPPSAGKIRQNVQLARVNFGRLRTAGTLRITCNLELPDSSLAPLFDVEVPSGKRQLDGNQGSEALCQRL
jgi:hypothetical protein